MTVRFWFFLMLSLVSFKVYSQKVSDITVVPDGDNFKISYTLIGDFPDQTFEVKVYTSRDSFAKPLEQIQGDVNRKNIKPGKKEAIWNGKKEFKSFEGKMSFRVIATVISNYWISSPSKGDIFKRGKVIDITWEGFKPSANVKIAIYYKNGDFDEITPSASGKTYKWKVRGDVGSGAFIRVTDNDNANAIAKSATFTIKRKIPLITQVGIAAVIIGGVVYYITLPAKQIPLPLPPSPV